MIDANLGVLCSGSDSYLEQRGAHKVTKWNNAEMAVVPR
jgi:hypothetical protein